MEQSQLKLANQEGHEAWNQFLKTNKEPQNPYDRLTEGLLFHAWNKGFNSNMNFGTL